jgi:predicted choloylglycine hydrolase
MLFSSENIPEYEIQSTGPQGWRHVMAAESETAKTICLEALKAFGLWEPIYRVFGKFYQWFGELYIPEIAGWAAATGQSFGRIATVNCSYEFSHFSELPFVKTYITGCTAGLVRGRDGIPVHVRTLDWPNQAMGSATRIFRLQMEHHRCVMVGFPGMVGALSGMVPGAYSVTIDWAPPTQLPRFDFGPLFLLRQVLETCPTYETALARLSQERLSSSVFFTLCGVRQGCIIERTHSRAAIRELQNEPLTQSNHFVSPEFQHYNEPVLRGTKDRLLQTTAGRLENLRDELLRMRDFDSGDLDTLRTVLARVPVTNEDTVQRMAFCPAHGSLMVSRRVA